MVIYPRLRLLYVAHVTFLYGNEETEFSKKLNFVKPRSQASPLGRTHEIEWSICPKGAGGAAQGEET